MSSRKEEIEAFKKWSNSLRINAMPVGECCKLCTDVLPIQSAHHSTTNTTAIITPKPVSDSTIWIANTARPPLYPAELRKSTPGRKRLPNLKTLFYPFTLRDIKSIEVEALAVISGNQKFTHLSKASTLVEHPSPSPNVSATSMSEKNYTAQLFTSALSDLPFSSMPAIHEDDMNTIRASMLHVLSIIYKLHPDLDLANITQIVINSFQQSLTSFFSSNLPKVTHNIFKFSPSRTEAEMFRMKRHVFEGLRKAFSETSPGARRPLGNDAMEVFEEKAFNVLNEIGQEMSLRQAIYNVQVAGLVFNRGPSDLNLSINVSSEMAGTGLLNSEDIAQLRMSSLSEKTMGKQEVIGLRFSIMDLDEKSIAKLHRAYLRASNLSQWPLQRDGRRKFEKVAFTVLAKAYEGRMLWSEKVDAVRILRQELDEFYMREREEEVFDNVTWPNSVEFCEIPIDIENPESTTATPRLAQAPSMNSSTHSLDTPPHHPIFDNSEISNVPTIQSNDFKDVTNTSARNLSSVTSWQSCSVPDADTTAYSLLAVVPSHLRSDDDIVSSNFMETSATGSTSTSQNLPCTQRSYADVNSDGSSIFDTNQTPHHHHNWYQNSQDTIFLISDTSLTLLRASFIDASSRPLPDEPINMDQFDNEATTLLNVIFGHTLSDQEVFRMVWVLGDMFTGKHRVNFTPFIHPSTSPIPPNIQQDRDQWYHQAYANILLIPEPFLNLLFSSFVDASSRQPMNMDRFQHEAVTLVNVIFGHSLSERKVWEMVVVIGEMFQETYQPQRVYAYVDTDGVTQDGERVFNEVTTDATLNGEEGVEKDEKRVGGLFGYGLKVLGNISGWMMRLVGL